MRLSLDDDLLMFSACPLLLHDLLDTDLVKPLPLVISINLRGSVLPLDLSTFTNRVVSSVYLRHCPPREVSIRDVWLWLKPFDLICFLLLGKALPFHLDPHCLTDQIVSMRALEILELVLQRRISKALRLFGDVWLEGDLRIKDCFIW